MMNRDEARATWATAGFTYFDLTIGRLQYLREIINDEMKKSRLMTPATGGKPTFRMRTKIDAGLNSEGFWATLRCKSYYFDDREAVTFNGNGFIGFAGWSDETNVQPILKGFVQWCAILKEGKDG